MFDIVKLEKFMERVIEGQKDIRAGNRPPPFHPDEGKKWNEVYPENKTGEVK